MKSGPHVLKRNARGYEEEQDQTGLERSARSTLGRSRGWPAGSQGVKGDPMGPSGWFDESSDDS